MRRSAASLGEFVGGVVGASVTAVLAEVAKYDPGQPRDSDGRWGAGGGGHASWTSGGAGSSPAITESELRGTGPGAFEGPGASRPVSSAEFAKLAGQGKARLDALSASSPPAGLDAHWDSIKSEAYQAVQESWGGATYDAHTGQEVTGGGERYALTVNTPGEGTVSIPEDADEATFDKAMDTARDRFGDVLSLRQRCLGVFHNDEDGTIEIDPSLVVNSRADVESIGAFTHAVGGAYNFADGNGYWPPHVSEAAAA